MPQSYKIAQVSAHPPREWAGPKGTVFYIKVKLEGHDRPVSIGKRAPDALKVGDTVYGTIVSDLSHDEDKFKAEQNPAYGSTTSGGSKPSYTPRDDMAIRAQWAIGQAMTATWTPEKSSLEEVEALAGDLFSMVDRVKADIAPVPNTQAEVDEDVAAAVSLFSKEEGEF